MSEMKYPIGIQNFEKLRREGYVYIDKTAAVHRLVSSGSYYFLSRPRRFGKSLLMSTIEAYFEGKRELFRGLAIDGLTEEWEAHPVLHIDMSAKNYDDADSLVERLTMYVEGWELEYGISNPSLAIDDRFQTLLRHISGITGRKVVILVDEYDKPLLASVHDEELQERLRNVLKAFYGVLKSCDAHIRFALLTGVTKFSKVSIFSDLNNLNDITLDERYSTICGITPAELRENFSEGIGRMAARYGVGREECLEMLRENYDGYHFSTALEDVYNPFSLLSALDKGDLGSFWFETGTPTFLARMISRDGIDLHGLEEEQVTGTRMMTADLISSDPVPVLFQSGYLTIKSYDLRRRRYGLGYPNREVKEGFLNFLLPYYTPSPGRRSAFDVWAFVDDVEAGRSESFMRRLTSLFSDFPYDQIADCERHYHNVVYLVFTLMGFYVRSEYRTSSGRCDAVVKTGRYIYIFEFKYDRTALEALEQIEERDYCGPFRSDGRKLIRIGVNFTSATRTIGEYLIKE